MLIRISSLKNIDSQSYDQALRDGRAGRSGKAQGKMTQYINGSCNGENIPSATETIGGSR